MGYTTEFEGGVKLEPALTAEQVKILLEFSEERHGGDIDHHGGMPGFWCNWAPNSDGSAIGWNGSEKFYDSQDWMRYLIENFLKKWGVVANGEILAQGEDIKDRWVLIVTNNVVTMRTLQ